MRSPAFSSRAGSLAPHLAAARAACSRRARTLPERNRSWVVVGILVALMATGFALRVDQAFSPARIDYKGSDALFYQRISAALYEDGTFGDEKMRSPFNFSPGAPLLYSATYAVAGGVKPIAARLLVALLGVLTIGLCYLLGRRLAGPVAGLVAAGLAAFYPVYVFQSSRLMSEPPAEVTLPAFVLAFLWAGDRRRPWWVWALPGALLGLTAFARPEYLLFTVPFAVLALLRARRRAALPAGLAAGAALAVATALVVTPWIVYASNEEGKFVPISTGGGMALYVGSNVPADGMHFELKQLLVKRYMGREGLTPEELKEIDWTPLLNRVTARYRDLERDEALREIGQENLVRYVTEDPVAFAQMVVGKMVYMWRGTTRYGGQPPGAIYHYAILALGALGLLLLGLRRRYEVLVVGVLIVGVLCMAGILLAGTRRNLVLLPLLMAFGGAAVVVVAGWVRDRLEAGRRGRPAPRSGARLSEEPRAAD